MTNKIKYDDFFFRGKKYSLQKEKLIGVYPDTNRAKYYFYLKEPQVFVRMTINHAQGWVACIDRDYKTLSSKNNQFIDFDSCPFMSLSAINNFSDKLFECNKNVVSKEEILSIYENHLNKYWKSVRGEERFDLLLKASYRIVYELHDTASDVELARVSV
jgi:hypothetical protein